MEESLSTAVVPNRRLHIGWIYGGLIHPRQTFSQIVAQGRSVWLTPILLLVLTTVARVMVSGWIRQGIMLSTGPLLPPDFQYYSPEQQAQFMQAAQTTSGPVFIYIFPLIAALSAIWIGWFLVSGLLHLLTTLSGGRGEMSLTLNIVAWASLPFAVRDIVRAVSILASRQLIEHPGLSGFAPTRELTTSLAVFASLLDIYLIWHIILLVIGVRAGMGVSMPKAIITVVLTIGTVIGLQALLSHLVTRLGNMTIIRPFF
jgi:hypothetical protein